MTEDSADALVCMRAGESTCSVCEDCFLPLCRTAYTCAGRRGVNSSDSMSMLVPS